MYLILTKVISNKKGLILGNQDEGLPTATALVEDEISLKTIQKEEQYNVEIFRENDLTKKAMEGKNEENFHDDAKIEKKSETRNELRAKLGLLGLSKQGNKETLLARLQEYENNKIKTELQSPNASTNLSNIKKTILLDRLKEHHESNQKWDYSFEYFQKKALAQ